MQTVIVVCATVDGPKARTFECDEVVLAYEDPETQAWPGGEQAQDGEVTLVVLR